VDDGLHALESPVRGLGIANIPMDERHPIGESRLVSEVDLGFQAVEDDHVIAEADQVLDEVRPDESSAPRN